MPLAYVLINVEPGKEKEVLEKTKKIHEIKASYMVYGIYDIVAVVETDTLENLREMVTKKIRQFDAVKSTVTSIVLGK